MNPVQDPHEDSHRRCAILGCKNARIASNCDNLCCRRHCPSLGGCKSKKHQVSDTERQRLAVIDPQLLTPAAFTCPTAPSDNELNAPAMVASLPPGPSNSQVHVPAIQPTFGKPKGNLKAHNLPTPDTDLLASTRHPSQLPPVFTIGYAHNELLRQQKEARELEERILMILNRK